MRRDAVVSSATSAVVSSSGLATRAVHAMDDDDGDEEMIYPDSDDQMCMQQEWEPPVEMALSAGTERIVSASTPLDGPACAVAATSL